MFFGFFFWGFCGLLFVVCSLICCFFCGWVWLWIDCIAGLIACVVELVFDFVGFVFPVGCGVCWLLLLRLDLLSW